MHSWVRMHLGRRPWWMNVLMLFCAYLVFVYLPWDLFCKPVARDAEVWFGIMFRGWGAKLTAPLHWAVYAAGLYGFWRMREWMWPWAAAYAAQLTFSTVVWNLAYVGGVRGLAGALVTGAATAALAVALWRARDRFQQVRPTLRERYGDWGLVTGASAGIGVEFARALARDGVSCVLVARRADRLQAVARDLEQVYGVRTRLVAADLATAAGVQQAIDAVEDLDVGILVNNAGFGLAGRFEQQPTERLTEMVELNCVAPLVLTGRLLPAMRARGRGAVIFTSSVAAAQPVPNHAVYSSTKVFDRYLAEALWAEMQGTGVDCLALEPGPTNTEFQEVAGELPHAGEPPERVVAAALDALGRQPSVVSGWFNWVQAQGARLLPRSLLILVAGDVMRKWTPETGTGGRNA